MKTLVPCTFNGLLNTNRYDPNQIDYARQIPCIAFAEKTYVKPRTLIVNIVKYYENNRVPQKEQFDAIFIDCRISVFNFKKYSYISEIILKV